MTRVGNIVFVSGAGNMAISAWSDIILATGLPPAVAVMRAPVSVQGMHNFGAFVSINVNGDLLLEPKDLSATAWVFFGMSYCTP